MRNVLLHKITFCLEAIIVIQFVCSGSLSCECIFLFWMNCHLEQVWSRSRKRVLPRLQQHMQSTRGIKNCRIRAQHVQDCTAKHFPMISCVCSSASDLFKDPRPTTKVDKCRTPGEIWTHNFWISKHVLNHCATSDAYIVFDNIHSFF